MTEPVKIPPEWMPELRALVKQLVNEALAKQSQVAAPAVDLEEPAPPARVEGSKKYVESRIRLAGTVPEHLMDLFERDRKARGKNLSQHLEFILFNHYRNHPLKQD